jgi:hypothetical protein
MTATTTNINLTWLNKLGSWEVFNFTARKTYGQNNQSVSNRNIDVFDNWDTDYISGGGDSEDLEIESRNTIVVRSQALTLQQLEAIKEIRSAISVYDCTNNRIKVMVDKGSFTWFTDKQKRKTIEFTITYPRNQIQIG